MSKVFVYGTLKRGCSAHYLMSKHDSKFIKEVVTHKRYQLYDQGYFPGMMIEEDVVGGVRGEVFDISAECLKDLDCYEGVSSNLFRRELIDLEDGSQAYAYIFARNHQDRKRVPTGEWIE